MRRSSISPSTTRTYEVQLVVEVYEKLVAEGVRARVVDGGTADGGKMDGFNYEPENFCPRSWSGGPSSLYPYQYVNPADIAPYWDMAEQYVLADAI